MAAIHLGTIVAVDMVHHTVDVSVGGTVETALAFSTPYQNVLHSGGVIFMPEVGAKCYVATADDSKSRPFVIAFTCDPSTNNNVMSHAGYKEAMEPGDLALSTADGNHVTVRRGGLVQIASTGLAQTLYIPVQNTIRDYFQRYQARTPLGMIDWGHATLIHEEATDNTTQTPVLVRYGIKELVQEDVTKHYTVELCIGRLDKTVLDQADDHEHIFASPILSGDKGSHGNVGKGVISLTVYDVADLKKVTYAFQVNRAGAVFMRALGRVELITDDDLLIVTGADKSTKFGKGATLDLVTWQALQTYLDNVVWQVVVATATGGAGYGTAKLLNALVPPVPPYVSLPDTAKAKYIKVE